MQRTFIPGSNWVYFKLYTGEKTADDMLIKAIAPIVKKLQRQQMIDKWFFIRYADPDFHLRVRLLVSESAHVGKVLHQFYQTLSLWCRDGLLWRVQIDTYNRELERYGHRLMEEAESLFYTDSECTLSVIKKLNGNENYRWMIALKLVDQLLDDFGLFLEEKQKSMERVSKSFKNEFGFNEFNSKQFNSKFRENKKNIEAVLNNTLQEEKFSLLCKFVNKRSKILKPIVEQIKRKSEKDSQINDMLMSYIHMTLNRLFRSKNRMHEMVLYDFMYRYYTSEIAKEKYKPKTLTI